MTTNKYSEFIKNGELTDVGLDYAIDAHDKGKPPLPRDMPIDMQRLIQEAWSVMDTGLLPPQKMTSNRKDQKLVSGSKPMADDAEPTLDADADDEKLVMLAAKAIYEQSNWEVLGIRNLVITPGESLTVEVVIENEDTKNRVVVEAEYDAGANEWIDRLLSEGRADEAFDLDGWRADAGKKGGKRGKRTQAPKCNKGRPCGMSCIAGNRNCRVNPQGAAEKALKTVVSGGGGAGSSIRAPILVDFTYHTKPTKTVFNDLRDTWQDNYKDNFWSDDKNKSNQIKVTQRILAEPNKDGRLREIRDSAGNLQAAAIITPSINRIRSPNDHLHVDWLATAPWNLPDSTDSRKVSGAGSAMIKEIIQEAKTNLDKYPGGIQLESLQAAVPFYKKLGFDVQTELNNVSYMVLSADKIRGMG